jgi:hypothetical protein
LLKVAVTDGFLGTPVAAFAGPVDITVGGAFGSMGVPEVHARASRTIGARGIVSRFTWFLLKRMDRLSYGSTSIGA